MLALVVLCAGPLLVVEDALQPADAIVVIGGDHKPERLQRALELYAQGYAPVILLSAGTAVREGTEQLPEAEVMRRQALALGIPPSALLLETESRTTYRNATYSKQLLLQRGFDEILLVTSAYHSRRARRIFNDVMNGDIIVSAQPAHVTHCAPCCRLRARRTPARAASTTIGARLSRSPACRATPALAFSRSA